MDLNPSSFDAYEGIRIILPGALVVTLYTALVAMFAPTAPSPRDHFLEAFVAALLIGLALLFVDLPAKSAAYRSADLPDRELRRWGVNASAYKGHVNLYFVMLDASFPAMVRNRALYTGAMYRIGFEGIYFVGLTAIGVVLTTALAPSAGPTRGANDTVRATLIAVAAIQAITFLGTLWFWYLHRLQRRDIGTPQEARRAVWKDLRTDISADGFFLLCVTIVSLAWYIISITHGWADAQKVFGAILVAAPALLWLLLYIRGRAQPDRDADQPAVWEQPRLPISPPSAVFLFCSASALAAVEAALKVGSKSPLSTGWGLAWAAASVLPALLMAARGHEKKLIGSYRTQTAWMKLNRDALFAAYKLSLNRSPRTRP